MNIDVMTLILIFLFRQLSAGPQKPQTLTASKIKYEKLGPKIEILPTALGTNIMFVMSIPVVEFSREGYKIMF